MTDQELLAAVDARREANRAIAALSSGPIRRLPPGDRRRVDELSARFRGLDALVVAELARRGGTATLAGVEHRLTRDGRSFVRIEPATGRPVGYPAYAMGAREAAAIAPPRPAPVPGPPLRRASP
jgi:hypothetical protein